MALFGTFTETVDHFIESWGYAGLASLILVENLFPPIPSELVLPFAGYLVSTGDMLFPVAVIAATLGSVVGALIIYGIARVGGRPLLMRYAWLLRVREQDLDRADRWLDRHGKWPVLFGRLIPGVRSLVSVPAGLAEMPLLSFVLLTTIGSLVWNTALIGAGWGLGSNYDEVATIIEPVRGIVVLILIVLVLAVAVWYFLRRRRAAAAARAGNDADA